MTAFYRIPPPPCLLLVLACTVALGSSGCSQRACFFWTEAEGACPAQDEAIDFLVGENCDSPIESVDSEPEFDGEMCCYDVTERASEMVCSPPAPGGAKPPSSGTGGIPTCQTCSTLVTNAFMGLPVESPCQPALATFDTLRGCLCEGACQTVCGDNLCLSTSASTACFDCATDSAVGCGSQFSACMNDN